MNIKLNKSSVKCSGGGGKTKPPKPEEPTPKSGEPLKKRKYKKK